MHRTPSRSRRSSVLFWVAVGALTLSALCIRLYRLDSVPPGLFFDEAYEGLDAYALNGLSFWRWPLFYTAINGREPLFVYLVHAAQSIWGPTILSVRVVSATAGALITPALIWLAWEISSWLGVENRRRFALWAGMASLSLLWPQTISRLGQRISLFGLLEVLAFAAVWRGLQTVDNRRSPLDAAPPLLPWLLAGVLAGLSFYTYLAVRLLPLVLIPLAVVLLLRHRGELWSRRWGLGLAAIAALVTAAPLLFHFLQFPQHFNMRTGQVGVLAQGWPALWANVQAVLGMAFVRGDFNFRLNYPNRPLLDALTLLPFLIGLGLALWRVWRPRSWRPAQIFLLAGLGVMLLPTLLSEEAPNFGRSFGAFPFVALLIALGLERTATLLTQRFPAARSWGTAAGWLLLIASTMLTVRVYFVDWANHPDSFAAWDTGYTAIAQQIRKTDSIPVIYAGPGVAENPSVEYLLSDLDPARYPRRFDGNLCLRVDTTQPAHYYVLPALTPRGAVLAAKLFARQSSRPGCDWDERRPLGRAHRTTRGRQRGLRRNDAATGRRGRRHRTARLLAEPGIVDPRANVVRAVLLECVRHTVARVHCLRTVAAAGCERGMAKSSRCGSSSGRRRLSHG